MHHSELWLIEHMMASSEQAAQVAELLDGEPKKAEFTIR